MPIVAGRSGSGALAAGVEEPLGGEPGLGRLEAEREVAEPGRLDGRDVALVDALRVEDVDPAADHDLQAGPHLEGAAQSVVAEPDAGELAVGVLQGEVGVAGGADRDPADLALHPQIGEPSVTPQGVADDPGDVRDTEHADRLPVRGRAAGGRLQRIP